MTKFKMLSLDTSTTETGFALFENGKLSKSGTIKVKGVEPSKRVDEMLSKLLILFAKEDPNLIVIEDLSVFNNMTTNKNLAEIIGCVRGYCVLQEIYFDRLAPNKWRRLVAKEDETIPTKRKDCKEWDIKTLERYTDKKKKEVNDNEADAILVGEAYNIMFGVEQ